MVHRIQIYHSCTAPCQIFDTSHQVVLDQSLPKSQLDDEIYELSFLLVLPPYACTFYVVCLFPIVIFCCPASKQVVIPAPRGMPDTRPEGGARPATCEFTCSAHAARGIPVQAHRPLHRDATTWGPGTRSQDTATGASPTWPPASADGYPRARTLVPATHSRAPLRVTPSGASRRRVPQARTPTRSDLAKFLDMSLSDFVTSL